MNLSNVFLKSFRLLLFPFSILYGGVIVIRNWLFDKHILKSSTFNLPIICVGNLSAGGTGKSPMVEYLIAILEKDFKVATLSRGYKRKTKGYTVADNTTTALEIGDEPMQFYLKHPEIVVAVGEERLVAIPQLLYDYPTIEAIVLDDALQHRSIRAGMNILLTNFNDLYPYDFFLPTGNLRDEKKSAQRAQIIIVTKCPAALTVESKAHIKKILTPKPEQQIFFTTIHYGTPYQLLDPSIKRNLTLDDEVLLICGIANPKPLKDYLAKNVRAYYQKSFNDHHVFSSDDLEDIIHKFNKINYAKKIILTTEKDAVRLIKFSTLLEGLPLYVLPIEPVFLFEQQTHFNHIIIDFIKKFRYYYTYEK